MHLTGEDDIKYETKEKFCVFDESGKLNEIDLSLLNARMASDKHKNDFPRIGVKKDLLFQVIRPEKDLISHLITHISYQTFSGDFFRINKNLAKPRYGLFPIFDKNDPDLKSPELLSDKIGPVDQNIDNEDSKIVFETLFGEKYKSTKMEKGLLYTGLFFSNNIIINIPLEEFCFPNFWLGVEEILKVFYVYCLGITTWAIDRADEKNFFIALHGGDGNFNKHEKLIKKIKRFIQKMKKDMFGVVNNPPRTPIWYCYQTFVCFRIRFFPDQSIFRKKYLKNSTQLGLEILSKQRMPFWYETTPCFMEKYPNAINNSGLIIDGFIKFNVECFVCFEKLLTTIPQNLPFNMYKPIDVIAEIACSKISMSTVDIINIIFGEWVDAAKSGWVQAMGIEIDKLMKIAEDFFKNEAKFFKKTEAFERKLKVLEECFYVDCRIIWPHQIEHLVENLIACFKGAMTYVTLEDGLERKLNNLINIFDKEFTTIAETSIPLYCKGSWNYSYERRKFRNGIKKIVDEKIRMNYFKGELIKKSRQPVTVWFHALFPHPFGKDVSIEPLSNDNSYSFEEKKERNDIKADIMRYVIQNPRPTWTYSSRYKTMLNEMKEEEFVFKEKSKDAIKRFGKSS